MSGSSGDLGNILAQAQKMQKALEEARAELRDARIDGTAGGGVVSATVNGMGDVVGMRFAEEAAKGGDAGMLQDLAVAALKDAQARAKRSHDERMAKVTGGMNLPGLF